MKTTVSMRIVVVATSLHLAVVVSARAETRTWEGDDAAEWTSTSFDSAGPEDEPTAAGDTAVFGEGATTSTVTVDSSGGPVAVGTLSFGGADAYTLRKKGADDTLTLSGAEGAGIAHTNEQNHLIGANVLLDSDLTATMYTEGYGVEISGDVSGAGRSVTKAGEGTLTLSGASTYDSGTWIERGVLRVANVADLAPGVLTFNSSVNNQTTVLETSGSFTRDIGTGAGEVHWSEHGGFAAYGGPLSVTLNGGDPLNYNSFNQKHIHFGSPSATHPVMIENDIDHNQNNTYIHVFYNPDTDQDVAVLAGVMSANNNRVRVYGGGTLAVTNSANTWSGDVWMEGATVRLGKDGAGLGSMYVGFRSGISVIESHGSLNMDTGTSAGNVWWANPGGFAAHGGPLTVTLNDGAQLDSHDQATGLRSASIPRTRSICSPMPARCTTAPQPSFPAQVRWPALRPTSAPSMPDPASGTVPPPRSATMPTAGESI